MFKIQEKSKPETAIWLVKENTIISNDGSGDLAFTNNKAESCKVKIQVDGDKVYLADLTFNTPIFLNDQRIPAGSKRTLKHNDNFRLGDVTFEIINPKMVVSPFLEKEANTSTWRLKAVGNWLDGQTFTLGSKTVIGRDNSCDIVIPGSHLSRRHAEFMLAGQTLLLRDLESANGSYVNGKKIKEANLKDGDMIKLDVLSFQLIAPSSKGQVANTNANPSPEQEEDDTQTSWEHANNQRNWVTKPTSIGNRTDDSLDIILAEHQRHKRILLGVFSSIAAIAAIAAIYFVFIR